VGNEAASDEFDVLRVDADERGKVEQALAGGGEGGVVEVGVEDVGWGMTRVLHLGVAASLSTFGEHAGD
jgi:hypothetical protein